MKNQEKIWNIEYTKEEKLWKKEVVNLPKICKNKEVLELGTGNGKTLISIIKQKPSKVIAMDFSSKSIEISSNLFKKEKNIKFLKADATYLPFKENSFEVIFARYILNNLIKKERLKAIKEIYRVLKEDGLLFFEDFALGDFRSANMEDKTEKNTLQKSNGMICHFFEKTELENLFKQFSKNNLKKISYTPFKNKKDLKRVIFSGILEK